MEIDFCTSKFKFLLLLLIIYQNPKRPFPWALFWLIWMNEILVTLKSLPFCMVARSLVGGPTIRHWSLEVRLGGDSFFCSFRSNELQSMVWSTILPPNFFVKPSRAAPQLLHTGYYYNLKWYSQVGKNFS